MPTSRADTVSEALSSMVHSPPSFYDTYWPLYVALVYVTSVLSEAEVSQGFTSFWLVSICYGSFVVPLPQGCDVFLGLDGDSWPSGLSLSFVMNT
jgi:hypothetical protein